MMKILILHSIYLLLVIPLNAEHENLDGRQFPDLDKDLLPKVLNHRSGEEVSMKCKDHVGYNRHEYKWTFYPCDECDMDQSINMEWKILPQDKKRLHLKSVTTADNGRYVCTANEVVLSSYHLKVSEPQNLNRLYTFIGRAPEIIGIEKREEIRPNDNVAVKCKIVSPLAPRVFWLKQCEKTQNCELNYDGNFYYKINVTYPDMQREENVYVSKLHLRNFTHRDDGLYVCVTMTELGKDYRKFTLTLTSLLADDDDNGQTSSSSLYYLFLVPILFILIPICIDCTGKRIGVNKRKQEVVLLEVLQPSTSRVYNC